MQAAYAKSTWKNYRMHVNTYIKFTSRFGFPVFPITQKRMIRYSACLSFILKSPESILNYLNGIKSVQKLLNFPAFENSPQLDLVLRGLRRTMQHLVKQAKPITPAILHAMSKLVRTTEDTVCFAALLTAFYLFLRKSNIAPDSVATFDHQRQFTRGTARQGSKMFLMTLGWTKTIQFKQKKLLLPLVRSRKSSICPETWLKKMIRRVPAKPHDPLFCLPVKGKLIALTSRRLQARMRTWLAKLKLSPMDYSLHSLRRGGATFAFKCSIPSDLIQLMGDWASNCYRRYIDVTLSKRLKAASRVSRRV